ncbi:ASCH domain [Klebsiella pneumoniae]|nr:ASCH domain [Klebsiella pneumoniae]
MTLPFSAFSGRHPRRAQNHHHSRCSGVALKPGDVLRVGRYEDDGYFCTIAVTATSTVTLDTLTEQHAQQENMTLGQLRQVISDIYPGESQFYVIEFKTL